jgi:protein-disulfide isomerase
MSSHLKPAVTNTDHIQGEASARITLVEYGDYQCPHCGAAYPIIKKMQSKFGDQIRFVFRNFPLSDAHPFAVHAAVAAEAAGCQDKFWQMHDVIFENQQLLSDAGLLEMANSISLNMQQFKKDIGNETLKEKVDTDFESGIRSGVNGTPSFFMNGVKFDGGAEDIYDMLEQNSSRF